MDVPLVPAPLRPHEAVARVRAGHDRVALGFALDRDLRHPKIARTIKDKRRGRPGAYYVVNLRGPEDVDDDVRDWLTESYLRS